MKRKESCFTGNMTHKGYHSTDFFCETLPAIASDRVKRVIKGYGKTSHLLNTILHRCNLLPSAIHTANCACLLALYVNAPDALSHFIPRFFVIALRNTTKILQHALRAAQNDPGRALLLIHERYCGFSVSLDIAYNRSFLLSSRTRFFMSF